VIHETEFVMSHRQYAVNPATLRRTGRPMSDGPHEWWSLDAAWFRRKGQVTTAVVGLLTELREVPPADAAQFLAEYESGHYGGRAETSWDGDRLWTNMPHTVAADDLELRLRPMLDNVPSLPSGYEGWWTFRAP
jgi:hypothetical protein